jgi:hypothetical protein
MLLLVLEIENKNTIHWIHQFVVRLTHETQENWFSTNKTCYTEYDANGKLLQILYPSEQRKVVYKYSMYSQLEKIYFDETKFSWLANPIK